MGISSSLPAFSKKDFQIAGLKLASILTDPICKTRESYYSLYTVGELYENWQSQALAICHLAASLLISAFLAQPGAALGALCRKLVILSCPEAYIYEERGEGIELPENNKLTLLSGNVCLMPGGFAETDGSVTPHTENNNERIDRNIKKINKLNPDVACLYEVPDIRDGAYISNRLSKEYVSFIPVAGPRTIGPNSMMYVASKYHIKKESIQFTPFIKDDEVKGRAASSEKGFLSFELDFKKDQKRAFVISSHLQHSEVPEKSEPYEVECRQKQIAAIMKRVAEIEKIAPHSTIILTGDLNQTEKELLDPNQGIDLYPAKPRLLQWLKVFKNAPLLNRIYAFAKERLPYEKVLKDNQSTANAELLQKFHRAESALGRPTWGGEKWGADLMGKKASNPLTLDYTFVSNGSEIETQIISAKFDREKFSRKARSDHDMLFSTITVA